MSENFIKIKETKIYLDDRIQTSPLGREFRFSSIQKDLKKPSKWINGMECWCWIYKFRYLDTNEFFGFYFMYENKFSNKI
jgi:hypothetical protein